MFYNLVLFIIIYCQIFLRTYAEMSKLNLAALKRILQDVPRDPVPTSDILQRRTIELKNILTTSCSKPSPRERQTFAYETIWNNSRTSSTFASNFFKDIPLYYRARDFQKLLVELGGYISHYSSIEPINQLRGKFTMTGVNGRKVEILLTLSPEKDAKIQYLVMKLLPIVTSLPVNDGPKVPN